MTEGQHKQSDTTRTQQQAMSENRKNELESAMTRAFERFHAAAMHWGPKGNHDELVIRQLPLGLKRPVW
jgi:hypothetical protein